MNSRLVSVLCLAAAVGTAALTPLAAASKHHHPCAYACKVAWLDPAGGTDHIASGTSVTIVRAALGSPLRELAPDVWVYRGFHADLDAANDDDCDMLIVTFAHGVVADLKLVNEAAVGILATAADKPARTRRYASAR